MQMPQQHRQPAYRLNPFQGLRNYLLGAALVAMAMPLQTSAFTDPGRTNVNCETDSCIEVTGRPISGSPFGGSGEPGGGYGSGSGEGGAGGGGGGPVEIAGVSITVDTVDDLQCISNDGAAQLNKDPDALRAAGRTTSRDSVESRHEAARLVTDIARLQQTIGSMIIGKGKINPTDVFDTAIVGIVFADGGMERYWLVPMVTRRVEPIDGTPIRMGDGIPKAANCTKG
jgi:hypothetical protein